MDAVDGASGPTPTLYPGKRKTYSFGLFNGTMRMTFRETHRVVSPAYGVDLSVVACHALLAHRRALLRDAGLTAVLVIGLCVAAEKSARCHRLPSARRAS